MAKRKSLTKKNRFEVFKRDGFTCQYCGKAAPETILEVDHIKPVSKGGDNELINLVTSCRDCNRGKSDKTLDDNSTLTKQKQMLDELNERKNQLEMMVQWREDLEVLNDDSAEIFINEFESKTGCNVTETGISKVKQWVKKYSLNTLFEALDESLEGSSYNTTDHLFNKIPKIAYFIDNPLKESEREIFYIRGIARNRFSYFDDNKALMMLKRACIVTGDTDVLKDIALYSDNWSQFKNSLEELISEGEQDE